LNGIASPVGAFFILKNHDNHANHSYLCSLKIFDMKKVVIILSILIYFSDAYSQNCGIAEKEEINSMVLYKAYLEWTNSERELFPDDKGSIDGGFYCYFDSDNNLRKIISWSEYPESSSAIIAYYNEEGELMYIIFSEFQPEGYSYQGIAYKTHSGEFSDSIDFKYKVQYNDMADFENSNVQGISNKYPSIIGEWRLSNYIHIDCLKSYLQIETLQPPPNCKKIQFNKQLSKNHTSFTNSHNVNLREQPNTSSKVITTIDIGSRVIILDVLQEELIENTGNYNWYRIDNYGIEGYIFGAFLEPVEIND